VLVLKDFYTQFLNECQIMLCKCHWIVLFTVHVIAFSLGGPFFSGYGVEKSVLPFYGKLTMF